MERVGTAGPNRGPVAADPIWQPGPWLRRDALLMLLMGLQGLAFAWPNRSRYVNVWDTTLFAQAIHDYDFLRGHPHPPGYPVFVFLTRAMASAVSDPHLAVLCVSAFFGAAACTLLYGLVREFGSPAAGVVAATLFALAPNLAYNSALALSYTAEAAASIAIAWLTWRAHRRPTRRGLVLLAMVFALGVGIRPSIAFYLAPLIVWSLLPTIRHPGSRPLLVPFVGAGALTGLAWFVPMILAGGGLSAWLATTRLQSETVVFSSTAFNAGTAAILDHSARFWFYLQGDRALVLVGIPALIALHLPALGQRALVGNTIPSRKTIQFGLLWAVPSLLFFTLVFSGWDRGPRGYALVFIPVLYAAYALVGQRAVRRILATTRNENRRAFFALGALAILLTPSLLLIEDSQGLLRREIRDHDEWAESWLGIREEFPPNETALLVSHSWAFAQWHLPDFLLWGYLPATPKPGPSEDRIIIETRDRRHDQALFAIWLGQSEPPTHPVPPNVRRVVLMDFQLAGENDEPRALADDIQIHEHHLKTGWRLLYFETSEAHDDVESWFEKPQPS